ncbi:hypothetical protein SKAU_G00162600 [Synaphobranchus kaupii]|uniref:DUF6729 domain-containing protein n=1 Tax=Synaphobranchus kaupii TaxID=118154 RepID=A0A9Q1FJE0_SYNKA|nr:hypothetical protein SKAU_G00162600 [Synaphobranchus kaupii]
MLLCPEYGQQLTGCGIHKRVQQVLDIDQCYYMITLRCTDCRVAHLSSTRQPACPTRHCLPACLHSRCQLSPGVAHSLRPSFFSDSGIPGLGGWGKRKYTYTES